MRFTKMHGLGNDYVFVNLFEEHVRRAEELARQVSDRHRGIGSDGLILIGPSQVADLSMRIYNADGSRGAMCGNGIRCVAKYAFERRLAASPEMNIETDSGIRRAVCILHRGDVAAVGVNMGTPSFEVGRLPAQSEQPELIDFPLELAHRRFNATCVSVGNPHAVIFVNDFSEVDLRRHGHEIEHHRMFPQRINAQFAVVRGDHEILVRTWERGSGATQACGTGACAVAAAAYRLRRATYPMTIELPGGKLEISIDPANGSDQWMTGPATEVYQGLWPDSRE